MGRPPVPPGEPTGLNKERPGQSTDALLTGAGSRSRERRPPGSHNPGDGQAVGMVNTCEPVIKIVTANEPKWLPLGVRRGIRLGPKGTVGWSAVSTLPPRGQYAYRSTAGTYPHTCFECGTWKPRMPPVDITARGAARSFPAHLRLRERWESLRASSGGSAMRRADRRAGLRCRKKRMPCCNGADTGPGGRARKRAHVRRVFRCERAR